MTFNKVDEQTATDLLGLPPGAAPLLQTGTSRLQERGLSHLHAA